MTDQATKQRNPSMKWLKLGEDKDPDFGVQYFLFGNNGSKEKPKEDFQVGALAEINTVPEGKKYSFFIENVDDQQKHFTHYSIAKPPVD